MNTPLIIFDIDQTLIAIESETSYSLKKQKYNLPYPDAYYENTNSYVWKRPFIDNLLNFCFNYTPYVALWTNASFEWANFVLNNVFLQHKNKFFFLKTREDSTPLHVNGKLEYLKILKNIWGGPFNKNNTVIIEDRYQNCLLNPDNSIIVSEFWVENIFDDKMAINVQDLLIDFFEKKLI